MGIISSNFNRLYWGCVINDTLKHVKILTWNNININITRMGKDDVHTLFKIITFRGDKSLAKMDNKEVVSYLEDIRSILAENSYTLSIDNEEWERIIKQIRS